MASAEAAPAALLHVEVVYGSGPRSVDHVRLTLPQGATVADALHASGIVARHGLHLDEQFSVGIWARPQPLNALLREADRVEVYRPLQVDPKEARRQRYRRQTGSKPGRA
ncbi:MAG TPA: RnfH family protein [Ideonella sp.]|uniref:RnfH family protein n=1 Tax=Ideonella sp. TaxID=1929293 RepID=UPI002BB313CF|nr:RnfH family protein [Ideonella sp.]HSI51165.1 RnfH family protein [Ideonella sp.]